MWFFLVNEVMFFGGLRGYLSSLGLPRGVHRRQPRARHPARPVNTAIPICSCLTAVLAVRSAQRAGRQLLGFLAVTGVPHGVPRHQGGSTRRHHHTILAPPHLMGLLGDRFDVLPAHFMMTACTRCT
jgi:hypothetical protein